MRSPLVVLSLLLLAAAAACQRSSKTPTAADGSPPGCPSCSGQIDTAMFRRVEVTIVTTGVALDPDGYGVLNDEWGYDVGDGVTVAAPTNGKVTLHLRDGGHYLSLVGVAANCRGENLDDRPITVEGDVTAVLFEVSCK